MSPDPGAGGAATKARNRMRYLIIRAVRTEYDTVRSDSAPVLSRAVAVPRPALPRGGGAAPGRRVGLSHPPTVYGHPADLHRNRLNVRSGSDVAPPPYHRRVRAVSVGSSSVVLPRPQPGADLGFPVPAVTPECADGGQLAVSRPPGDGLRVDSKHRRDFSWCEQRLAERCAHIKLSPRM